MNNIVFLALGSNIGDRKKNIDKSIFYLKSKLDLLKKSSIYETKPMYFHAQDLFLNMAIKCHTNMNPDELIEFTQNIELKIGRDKNNYIKNGPRVIDIDILLYNDLVFKSNKLEIPHPLIEERQFVLKPLLEIEKNIINPRTGVKYIDYAKNLNEQGVYTWFAN